jgi:hypothetical protein
MSDGRLHVERLELRLRGASLADARTAAAGLGAALLDELARRGAVRSTSTDRTGTVRPPAVDAAAAGSGGVRGALARAAAGALAPHLPRGR